MKNKRSSGKKHQFFFSFAFAHILRFCIGRASHAIHCRAASLYLMIFVIRPYAVCVCVWMWVWQSVRGVRVSVCVCEWQFVNPATGEPKDRERDSEMEKLAAFGRSEWQRKNEIFVSAHTYPTYGVQTTCGGSVTGWRTRRILYFSKRGQLHCNLSAQFSRWLQFFFVFFCFHLFIFFGLLSASRS